MNWLARILGVCSIALALLIGFVGLIMLGGGQETLEHGLTGCWIALTLAALGAVPFIPTLAERPWSLSACLALVYLTVPVLFLGLPLIGALQGPVEWGPAGLAVIFAVVLAAPAIWVLRRGVGARTPAAPEPAPTGIDPEFVELAHAHTAPRKVIVAASMLGWSAGLAGFSGLQLMGVSFRMIALNSVPWLFFLFAAGLAWAALGVYKLRFTQGAAGFALSLVVSLASTAWLVFGVRGGFVTLFGMVLPPVSAAAAITTFRQLIYLRRATEARERLEDQGLSLGL